MQILRHAAQGLAHMHAHGRLHQSLGPGSLLLSTVQERDVASLRGSIADLAFSVDVTNEALLGGASLGELWEARGASVPVKYDFALFCGVS